MDRCSSCNWSGPAGLANCPRCGQPLGSPAGAPTMVQTSTRPVLLLKLLGGELPPEEWEIEGVPVGIGRLDDSDITLPHRSVSRHHARIVPSANGYEVEDLGSTNGTWLNDKPLNDRTTLSDGDSLMVGDIPLVVELIQPKSQAQPEIYDVPQLPAGQPAPARGAQAPEGGASTVFYELDAALAAAGPAEPAPPQQPAPPPADDERTRPPLQPPPRPNDYQQTQTQAPPLQPGPPANNDDRTQTPPPLQPAQRPKDDDRTQTPPPLQPAQRPAEYQQTSPPLQPAQRPADYQQTPPPLEPAQPPAGYRRTPSSAPAAPPLEPIQPPAGYRRTPSPATPAPPAPAPATPSPEVEVPRAWDDTPSTRLDLPSAGDLADNDEHPTLIGQVPVEQFQGSAAVAPPQPPPALQPRDPRSAGPQTAPREQSPAGPQTSQREPSPAGPQTSQREPWPAGPQTPQREPSPTGPQTAPREPWANGSQAVPQYAPAQPRTAQAAASAVPASGSPDLSAAGLIDLAEHLATALRVLKGDLALAMWLFEHAGGPGAAQEFVDYVRRFQADPNNPQDVADVLESAPGAARLLEAAILLVNVLSSLDPPGGIDDQLEADAADLQPVARS